MELGVGGGATEVGGGGEGRGEGVMVGFKVVGGMDLSEEMESVVVLMRGVQVC